jgi:hypothetical protein
MRPFLQLHQSWEKNKNSAVYWENNAEDFLNNYLENEPVLMQISKAKELRDEGRA